MRLAVVLIAAALLLAGCASAVSGRNTPNGPNVTVERVDPPPDQLVLQIDVGLGYLQEQYEASDRPELSVYGDGTAYVVTERGVTSELARGSMTRDDLTALIRTATATGLFTGTRANLGDPGITDAATTRVSFRPGLEPARTASAYALQYDDNDDRLDPAQRQGRRALRDLISRANKAVTTAKWTPDRIDVTELRIYTRTSNPQPWPGPALDTVLSSAAGRCGVVVGPLAGKVYATAIEHGNLHWSERGVVRPLAIRALLPGETGCKR